MTASPIQAIPKIRCQARTLPRMRRRRILEYQSYRESTTRTTAGSTRLRSWRGQKKKRRRYTLEQLLAGLSREDKIGWGPPRAIVAIASTVVGTSFPAGLGAAKTRLSDSQGETPNSFSISDIIGCVKPALRNAAKSAAMTRSHSLASCCDIGLPL